MKKYIVIINIFMVIFASISSYLVYDVFNRDNKIVEMNKNQLDNTILSVKDNKITEEYVTKCNTLINNLNEILSCEDSILNENGYIISANKLKYLNKFEPYFSNKDEINKLSEILESIHKEAYRKVEGITLVGLGKAIYDNMERNIITIDINSVGDTLGYKIQRIRVYLDDNMNIFAIEKDGNLFDQPNTTTPFNENSIINVDTNYEFRKELDIFLNKITDDDIYEKIMNGEITLSSNLFNSYIDTLNIKEKDKESLFVLLSIDPKNFKNVAIIEYQLKDIDVCGVSTYIISLSNDGSIINFKFDFNRFNNQLECLSKI